MLGNIIFEIPLWLSPSYISLILLFVFHYTFMLLLSFCFVLFIVAVVGGGVVVVVYFCVVTS